jgi:hypothetical protein
VYWCLGVHDELVKILGSIAHELVYVYIEFSREN